MQQESDRKQLNIAVGIIRTADNQIFITQRGESSHLAGYWEFPGGKVKNNETAEQALYRELEEEIDIVASDATLLETLAFSYPDRDVLLHFFMVEKWDGEPFAKEGQHSRWVAQHELKPDDFPDGNRSVIELLLL